VSLADDLAPLGWEHVYSGKVRDLYRAAALPGRMLVVASDRVSAFDHVLEPGIPGKGALLTDAQPAWWFEQLDEVYPITSVDGAVPDAVPPTAPCW
jgi:phosphoribosylaminoimidazole-succinocarboxamide synthase